MRALHEDEEQYEVPLTPLIDIVFLLLIFFLVATNFSRKEIDQKVKLPKAEGGTVQNAVPESLIINIREDGTIVVNGHIIENDSLRLMATQWHAAHPDKRAAIRADGRVPYVKVMKIMGMCKAVGIVNVDLPVEEEAK